MASPRIAWAVDALALRAGDTVLETGPGDGVAASLVADRLTTGSCLGVDRSVTMMVAAVRRDQHHLDAGRVGFITDSIETWSPPDATFDLAFAIRVAILADGETGAIGVIHRALKPGGRLHVAFQEPSQGTQAAIIERARHTFAGNGFAIDKTIHGGADVRGMTGLVAPGADWPVSR